MRIQLFQRVGFERPALLPDGRTQGLLVLRLIAFLMRAFSLTATLLLALSGCGAEAPGACKVESAVDVPLLDHARMPIVVGRLDNRQVAMLLDTGAATSIVLSSAVARFRLDSDPDHVILLSGIGGTTQTHSASIHSLELGRGHAHNFDLPIATGMPASVRDLPMLGMFGADFMSNYDVDIDLPHHHFAMYDLVGCGEAIQPVETPYFTVPFRLDGTAIDIEMKLDGVPVEADLDSGAATTLITRADARRAGVTPDMLAADPVMTMIGVDGGPVAGRRHRFTSLELGNERFRNFRLAIAPSAIGMTLLGDDFLRLNRVWISYPRRMLFIQPATGNPIVHMAAAGPAAPGR